MPLNIATFDFVYQNQLYAPWFLVAEAAAIALYLSLNAAPFPRGARHGCVSHPHSAVLLYRLILLIPQPARHHRTQGLWQGTADADAVSARIGKQGERAVIGNDVPAAMMSFFRSSPSTSRLLHRSKDWLRIFRLESRPEWIRLTRIVEGGADTSRKRTGAPLLMVSRPSAQPELDYLAFGSYLISPVFCSREKRFM